MLVGQRLHVSHDYPLIRSWGIRHEKRLDVDEVLYQHCVKKLLVGYLTRDYRPLFPRLPERTRLFRLLKTHQDWTRVFLAAPTVLGVIDTYGIELIHPMREGRSPQQIGRKGLSNHRWIVGGKLCLLLNQWGLAQLPHSKPCFGSIKAHKCLVFLEECWKAHIVTNSTSFSLDFPNEYARLDSPIEVMKPKT